MWAQIAFSFVDNYNIIEIGIEKVCISGNDGNDGLDLARYTYLTNAITRQCTIMHLMW